MDTAHLVWTSAAAVCTVLCWKIWPAERRRILAVWLLIILSFGFHLAAGPAKARWISEVANSLQELAFIQLFAIFLFELVIKRWSVHMILSDILIGIGYIVILFRLMSRLGTDLNGLIATSTVVTAIIGLAMQDILVNSVGGIVLQLEGEIALGDYIVTEHGSGWVRKVRTRYTALETVDADKVLIPNLLMNKGSVRIVSKAHRVKLGFHVPYDHLPTTIIERVDTALRSAPMTGVSPEPKPFCFVQEFHPGHIEYGVYVWITTTGLQSKPVSEVLTRIYFALSRAQIPLSAISQFVDLFTPEVKTATTQDTSFSIENLRRNPVFHILTPEELEFLASRLKRVSFAPGETIVSQGDEGESLYVLVKGRSRVVLTADHARSEELAILEPGSLFGEMSLLTGERRSASVIAASQVDCDRLDKSDFAEVLTRRPELAETISREMCQRLASLDSARLKLNATPMEMQTQNMMERIQKFFGI